MKVFSVCVYLTLAALLCVEVSGRTRIGSRTRTRPTKPPIVQIRDDKPGVQPQKNAFGEVDGQATVSTKGLEEMEHSKLKKAGKAEDRVPGRYIAVMKENAGFTQVAGMLDNFFGAAQRNGSLQISGASTFVDGVVGFTAQMNKPTLEMMLDDPNIAYIEEDQKVQGARFFQLGNFESDVEVSGQAFQYPFEQQWHNDRIDQRRIPLDGQYNPRRSGAGVDIFILDSGIRYSHNSFNGRARFGGYDHYNGDASDWHGHGTHCAGLAGGRIVGTAQRANLYSIRVLNAQLGGTFAGVIAGVNHVIQRVKSTRRRTVISMSLIGGKSDAVADVLRNAKKAGIVTVVAAGNFRRDACAYHPAASPDAITVGGTQEDRDQLYWFTTSRNSPGTNYGPCVDIFAPGQWVRSASHTRDNTLVSMSGTSMATPIVAGAAALLMEQYPSYTPDQIANELYRMSTKHVLDFSVIRGTNTVNRLLYVEPGRSTTTAPTNPTTPTIPPSPTESTRKSTPATPETETTSPPTGPRPYSGITTALPSEPSRLSQPPLNDLSNALLTHKNQGFVPESVSPFKVYSQQYFSIVYTYVGTTASQSNYQVRFGLTEAAARDFIDNTSGFKVQIIAPYIMGNTFHYLVVMNKTNDATAYFLNETPDRFSDRYVGLRNQGFSLISRKILHTSDIYISGVAKVRTQEHAFFDNEQLTGLYNRIDLEYKRGFFLSDLHSYVDRLSNTVRYAGIFSPERFGSAQYIILTDLGQESLFNQAESYAKMNYHLKTALPLPRSNYPYFLATWWK